MQEGTHLRSFFAVKTARTSNIQYFDLHVTDGKHSPRSVVSVSHRLEVISLEYRLLLEAKLTNQLNIILFSLQVPVTTA